MGKDEASGEKRRSLFWIGLLVLVVMMAAIGWQAKSLLRQPGPPTAPAPVRAKVPPVPPPPEPIPISDISTVDMIDVPSTNKDSSFSEKTTPGDATSDSAPETPPEGASVPTESDTQSADKSIPPQESQTDTAPAGKTVAQTNQSQPDSLTSEKSTATKNHPVPEPPTPEPETLPKKSPTLEPAPDKPEPPPAKVTPAPSNQTDVSAPYAIQVGAYRTKSNAVKKTALLSKKGYDSYIFEFTGANQKPWFTVRFGRFKTRDQAVQALSEFKKKEKMDGIISRTDAL